MSVLPLVLLIAAAGADPHLEHNPIFQQLIEKGVEVADGDFAVLPSPSLPDGLDAAAQRAVIEALPERHAPVDQLLRKSVVAPLVYRFRKIEAPGRKVPVHAVDVWFVAYGRLETLTRKDVIDDALRTGQNQSDKGEGKVDFLTAEQLRAKGIEPPAEDDKKQRYVHTVFPLLDRVQLGLTVHTYIGQTKESIVAATVIDRRFTGDPQLPNQWQPLKQTPGGKLEAGDPKPYEAGASYLKVTQLAEPAGALLIEQHVVFVEPEGWFDGAPLLRSKLPIIVQSEIRKFRRELARRESGPPRKDEG